jgi:hypothetical protein
MEPIPGSPPRPERRTHPHLRKVFHGAARRIDHFFHGQDDWVGTSQDFLALRIVHEHYPELSPGDVRTLVGAIGRRIQPPGMAHGLTA